MAPDKMILSMGALKPAAGGKLKVSGAISKVCGAFSDVGGGYDKN
jgi:hypothetical protein